MKEDLQLMYLTNSSILLFLLLFCGCDTIYEMYWMSSLPPRGTCAHAPPLDHLDTGASLRRGHTSAPAAANGEKP